MSDCMEFFASCRLQVRPLAILFGSIISLTVFSFFLGGKKHTGTSDGRVVSGFAVHGQKGVCHQKAPRLRRRCESTLGHASKKRARAQSARERRQRVGKRVHAHARRAGLAEGSPCAIAIGRAESAHFFQKRSDSQPFAKGVLTGQPLLPTRPLLPTLPTLPTWRAR